MKVLQLLFIMLFSGSALAQTPLFDHKRPLNAILSQSAPLQWQSIGPSTIPQSSGPRASGKLQAFAVDIANPSVMYAGGGAGPGNSGPYGESGVFKTTDGGTSWAPADSGLTDPMVDALWLDQTNPSTLLAGTWFDGIFLSTDAGVHWTRQGSFGSTTAFLQVGQSVYAATALGIAKSTNSGAAWTVINSTSVPVRALAASGSALYAGLDDGRVLFQATPSSAWQLVLSNPGRTVWSLAADPSSTQTIYVIEWSNYQPDLFVTTNSGGTWTLLFPPGYQNAAQVVAVDTVGNVYAGFDGQLDLSTDHGATWATVPGTQWDIRFLFPWPNSIGKLVVGGDQGLYITSNGGSTWVGLHGHISSSLLTGLAVSGSTVLTAVQDFSPIASFDGGTNWQQFWGSPLPLGEIGIMRFNSGNPSYAYAFTISGFQYSTNGGHAFSFAPTLPNSEYSYAAEHNMISVDPLNPSNVYAVGRSGIFKSSNWGVFWALLPWSFSNPSLVVVSPAASQTIFVGTQGPGLYVTHDGGSTWAQSNLGGAAGYPIALDVAPGNPNIVEVGMTQPPGVGGGVLLSTDGGNTFSRVNSGLNSASAALSPTYVWALSFNPGTTKGEAALATANGIYFSAAPGAAWINMSNNAIPKEFTDLAWVGSKLYAATYGEGVIECIPIAITAGSSTIGGGTHGNITPAGTILLPAGANQSFTINPDVAYHVDSLFVDDVNVDSTTSYTFMNLTAYHTIRAVFQVTTYTIAAASGANGSISPSGIVGVADGGNKKFTIIANAGYHKDSLIVDGVNVPDSTTSYTFTNVTANHSIRAVFAQNIPVITATAGSNGSISPPGATIITWGTNQTFAITPNTGYHKDSLLVDGVNVPDSTTSYTFVNVITNHTIRAAFQANAFTIAASSGANGSILPSGDVTVDIGTNKTFTISPVAGYQVDSLLVDGNHVPDSTTSYTFINVVTNHTIHVTFSETPIKELVGVEPGWNMLSVAVRLSDYQKTTVYPSATSNAFTYQGGYAAKETLANGPGFWLRFGGPGTVSMIGFPIVAESIDVAEGWNLLGSISSSIAASGITSDPGGIITSRFFGYNGSYVHADTLVPSHAYWVKVNQAGRLILSSASSLNLSNTIRINATEELPPPAPNANIGTSTFNSPKTFTLAQNYPNPFNPVTLIRYELPVESRVTLRIYNVLGQHVGTIVDGVELPGFRSATWDPLRSSSGVYFYRLDATSTSDPAKIFSQVRTMIFLK